MSLTPFRTILLFIILYQINNVQASHPRPIFSDSPDPLDLVSNDYYDDAEYPEVINEAEHYMRRPPGGLVTAKPIVKPDIPPDIEPIDYLKTQGRIIKVGRIQGKPLFKTEDRRVNGDTLVVNTQNMGRTIKGMEIDVSRTKTLGYSVGLRVEGTNYIITVKSNTPFAGTAQIKYYSNPPWKRMGKKVKKRAKRV